MVTDNTSQADDTTAFLRAARSGNLEKVIEFLDIDLDINTANSNGLNALHLASKDGHVEIVTELLKRGAKVDAATKKGNTALHIASLAGQVEIVNTLIQYGAAVNIQSQNGFTPLYMAAQENHDQVVKLLLNSGANQSLATEDGFTPLAVAMQQGHDKVVSVLLENDSKGKVRLPALHIAAKKDDCKAADLLLQNDHKPDVTSKSGFTPLHIAAHYGNEEIARLLIKRGADVNYLAKHNISPLHVAAKWGKNNMVEVLLENSAQIDAKTRDGLTPLHCAARSGHEQVITTLLEHSAPISARTKNGLAPLHMASQGDHVDAARVLLYHRAPVDEVTIDYLTSLHVAAHCGHVRVAKLLLDRKADPNARALNGFTPLHIACKKNRIKVVELLLKHGASIESTTESGLTPLHVASFMGCMNIVIFLLQHEANPDVPTVRGETPLHLAARANQTDIIRILLRNGAKVDARAREQQTPLHIASRLGNIDIVMLLLQHGAAVDTTTKDMYTALHIAAKEGQEEVATILVENNASLKATTKNGFTPLHIAAKYGNMSVAKILLQRDSKLDAQGKNDISPLHLACHYDHPNVANLLLEEGASPHLASQNGHTPLHIAARKNQMDIASTLLENGANANAESKAGFTPLHLSAQKGHYDMTNLLIEHGADPNHKSKNGLTALHLCAQEDFIKVASILVKNGADVESQTETGYRPIHVAAHFGNLSMIRFLLKHNASIDVVTNQSYTPLHQAAQQGHAHIVTALLEGNASHKARTSDGLTALNIAQKLGYISVMEALKGLSYDTLAPDNKNWDEKYKVIAPESLQETNFMSDSDDEGGSDALISEQPYRYLTADLMKSLRDDSLPIDVTRDDPIHRQITKEEKQDFTQSNNYCLAENFETDGFNLGFLVSFLVDARGGALKGCRHSGVRIIIPPRRATMPIRVTCRLIKPNKVANPPPLMEGEALATRIIEMGPVGATFLGPVLIDIPHFASIRGKEREIIILRSENGETWKEHDNYVDNDTTLLNTPHDPQMSAAHSGRITRIITTDFPQYFAIITRIKQEVHVIGAEGGILTSSVASDVQAVFPPGALTKKIKVGLQAHVIPAELTAKLLGNCVAVSPVITIEPRRRKFHKPITLTIPVPQAANKGMINQYGGETPTLRLLCSIAGGTSESQWEDVTGSTPLTFMNDTVSFTTTVSARFWLMDCRNIGAVPKMATELYEESLFVPYITNFVIYSKRMDMLEATLRILCMTDGKEGMHTLERQEEFVEIVKSRDVEALDGKDLYIEFSGNLVPVTKSGVQLKFTFKAFRQNRLSFHVKVKDPLLDPVARMLFMREPKVAKGEPPQQPICVLNIVLPEVTSKLELHRKLKDYQDSNIISQKLDSYESKYKMEEKEKGDEPKDTSPSEKKFITDTLQKERTDAATIQESLAQKAACPLESVDASYPSKIVGQEQDLSPSVERQTYSEKRKFWEDISRKRDSYQRSESEMSRTSQITVNESDSECVQNLVTSDTTETEAKQVKSSETLEDLNMPDISECSVAEKAQYFEEQIQRETTKQPCQAKAYQQDPVSRSEKERADKSRPSEREDRFQVSQVDEKESVQSKKEEEIQRREVEDEKEKDESKQVQVVEIVERFQVRIAKQGEDYPGMDQVRIVEKIEPRVLEGTKVSAELLKADRPLEQVQDTGRVYQQIVVEDVKVSTVKILEERTMEEVSKGRQEQKVAEEWTKVAVKDTDIQKPSSVLEVREVVSEGKMEDVKGERKEDRIREIKEKDMAKEPEEPVLDERKEEPKEVVAQKTEARVEEVVLEATETVPEKKMEDAEKKVVEEVAKESLMETKTEIRKAVQQEREETKIVTAEKNETEEAIAKETGRKAEIREHLLEGSREEEVKGKEGKGLFIGRKEMAERQEVRVRETLEGAEIKLQALFLKAEKEIEDAARARKVEERIREARAEPAIRKPGLEEREETKVTVAEKKIQKIEHREDETQEGMIRETVKEAEIQKSVLKEKKEEAEERLEEKLEDRKEEEVKEKPDLGKAILEKTGEKLEERVEEKVTDAAERKEEKTKEKLELEKPIVEEREAEERKEDRTKEILKAEEVERQKPTLEERKEEKVVIPEKKVEERKEEAEPQKAILKERKEEAEEKVEEKGVEGKVTEKPEPQKAILEVRKEEVEERVEEKIMDVAERKEEKTKEKPELAGPIVEERKAEKREEERTKEILEAEDAEHQKPTIEEGKKVKVVIPEKMVEKGKEEAEPQKAILEERKEEVEKGVEQEGMEEKVKEKPEPQKALLEEGKEEVEKSVEEKGVEDKVTEKPEPQKSLLEERKEEAEERVEEKVIVREWEPEEKGIHEERSKEILVEAKPEPQKAILEGRKEDDVEHKEKEEAEEQKEERLKESLEKTVTGLAKPAEVTKESVKVEKMEEKRLEWKASMEEKERDVQPAVQEVETVTEIVEEKAQGAQAASRVEEEVTVQMEKRDDRTSVVPLFVGETVVKPETVEVIEEIIVQAPTVVAAGKAITELGEYKEEMKGPYDREEELPETRHQLEERTQQAAPREAMEERRSEISVVRRSGTPEVRAENIVREKSSGRRIITEETTIIYKVQKDGSLVQEQVLKSVQVEGGEGALAALRQMPETKMETKTFDTLPEGFPAVQLFEEVKSGAILATDVKKEMQRFLERERTEAKAEPEGSSVRKDETEAAKKEEILLDRKAIAEPETRQTKKEFESRIPISTAKIQKETKVKGKQEGDNELQDTSPTGKKKEFESRIPKRVVDVKATDKPAKKESYTITEKKSSEEVTSKTEEHLTTKSETQTFSKTFTDPQQAFKAFEDLEGVGGRIVTSKIDHKTSSTLEKKEVVSSEISSGTDKVITLEEKERVEKKKSSESQLKKESPTETLEEKETKRQELDKTAIQRMSMNLTDAHRVIDAAASESRAESKKEEKTKKLSDEEGVTTRETGSSILRESDANVAIRVRRDVPEKGEDLKTVEEKSEAEEMFKSVTDSDHVETLAQGESHRETKESFDVTEFVPLAKKPEEKVPAKDEEQTASPESLEEKQKQKFKEIEARTIAETLIQSIESELEEKSAAELKAELLSKGYLEQIISESVETDHEKLADDLTRKFESIMRKSMASSEQDRGSIESCKQRSSIHEEFQERASTRDSISVSEDITKDEESSPADKDESFPLSLSQVKLQDRDITMSPSSISEQIDFEETIDIDTNELEGLSKPTSSLQSEKQHSERSSSQVELQRDFQSDPSFLQDKIVSEISGARVLEILEPGVDSQSREDSVDVPSLEMDEYKVSEQTSRGIPSLHESAEMESFERLVQERDITISPSTVSEDTNIDYSLVQESSVPIGMPREHEVFATRRADSFEIESPPLISPKSKVRGLEIKTVDWMIGDEKIEISETLQPSQIFNQELEAYETTLQQKTRPSSLDGSSDHEQESATKSSEDVSVIESTREPIPATPPARKTKFTVIPVSEQDFESELVEDKLDVSCQELVDTLQREYDAKTPIKEYVESMREELQSEQKVVEVVPEEQSRVETETSSSKEASVQEEVCEEHSFKEQEHPPVERRKEEEEQKAERIGSKADLKLEVDLKLERTTTSQMESEKPAQESEREVRVDDVLKEWTEAYLSKMKPLGEEYKRHMEKGTEKHDKPGRSATVPSDTCAFKVKKDDHRSVDLSARYAITVLDQVVKKEIAEVKESLEAAKQDLIEELSENNETVIQIKDSPSEFQFKLQPESIPNDLPFLYTPSFPEQSLQTGPEVAKPDPCVEIADEAAVEVAEEVQGSASVGIEEATSPTRGETPVIKTEKSDEETAALTVQEDTKDEEEEHLSPAAPASRSGSDVDNKDESSSLALPRPVLRRRQKTPGRSTRRVTSESEAELGSSSGESSNYQSCDYEIGSGSRPSSSDMEAMQSCGVPSATTSEYETAVMSMEHSSLSKPTSQEYHTAVTTMSSRESMKSLTSLSSGQLGSIDSTSELSETLVPSETEGDKDEADENLDGALEDEQTEQSDSSGSDIPIDHSVDKIDSHIPCRMKRSSEMIFPQVLDDSDLDPEYVEQADAKDAKGVDFAAPSLAPLTGPLQSVDIMTSRISVDGVQSVCTQVISTLATAERIETEIESDLVETEPKIEDSVLDPQAIEADVLDQKYVPGTASGSPEMSMQASTPSMIQQASMSTSSTSGVSIDTVIGKEKSDRHSPDSDSFEMVDKPDIIDDFVVIEEVGREAEEYDSEGKSIRISSIPQVSSKNYDRDLENLITETKEDSQVSSSQGSKNNELFDFESEESPPQVSNDDQYSQSYSDDEQYEGGKKWMEMQFQAEARVYDIEYDRGPLEDIKEEEITDFEAGSSRFGSLGSHKESIGSVGSMRGSFGSTPDYDVLAGKKYFTRPSDHDNISLSSLQEFENLESAVAAENSKRLQCGSHDSVNNGSLPRRYMASRSGHGDDVSLSSLKDFEGLEKACREAHLIELRAREEEDLLEHESPENRYKLESVPRTRVDVSTAGSFNASTSGSDDYEKRIKEIDEIIRIAQSNVEKFDRQDDTTEDISQIEVTDAEKIGAVVTAQSAPKPEEPEAVVPVQREGNIMETSTDSLELEENMDKKHHPLCRSSDSLEMKTTLDFPSLSSDSLNNVRDAKEPQSDVPGHPSSVRRISSDSLDMPLLEQQDPESQERRSIGDDQSDNSLEQRSEPTENDPKADETKTKMGAGT